MHPGLGQAGPLPSLWHIVADVIVWAMEAWDKLRHDLGIRGHRFPKKSVHRFLHWSAKVGLELDMLDERVRERLLGAAQEIGFDMGRIEDGVAPGRAMARILGELVLGPVVAFKHELWNHVFSKHEDDAGMRLFFTTLDTFVTAITGILDAGVITRGFTAIDDSELIDFLRAHKAEEFTLELEHSPFLRGWYDAAFAYRYEGGKPVPDLAAGTGIHGILRLLSSYRQAVAFKMQAGMGDTVFGPLLRAALGRAASGSSSSPRSPASGWTPPGSPWGRSASVARPSWWAGPTTTRWSTCSICRAGRASPGGNSWPTEAPCAGSA